MPEPSQQPINVVAGVDITVAAPVHPSVGGTFQTVQYNYTGDIINVSVGSGSYFLMPNMADQYTGGSGDDIAVQAQFGTATLGAYLGTIQALWAQAPDQIGGNYPLPLVPFPGGSVTMAVLPFLGYPPAVFHNPSTSLPTATAGALVVEPAGTPLILAVIPGANEVTFQAELQIIVVGVIDDLWLVAWGVNSGQYGSPTLIASSTGTLEFYVQASISLIGTNDTEIYIGAYFSGPGALAVMNVENELVLYESPGTPIPANPQLVGGGASIGSTDEILAAPPAGTAWYVFNITVNGTSNSTAYPYQTVGGGSLGFMSLDANGIASLDLGGMRVTGELSIFLSAGGTADVSITYSPGP